MREAVRRYVALYYPRKDGSRLATHCEAVAEAKGEWPEEHPLPEVPEAAMDEWDWYFDIRSGIKSGGMGGVEPVSPGDVHEWATLYGVRVSPAQARILKIMDAEYMTRAVALRK